MIVEVASNELKARLGRGLRVVRCGDRVVVTVRGEPVARRVPFVEEESGDCLRRLEARRLIRLPGSGGFRRRRPVRMRGRSGAP